MNVETIRYLGPFLELLAAITGTIFFYKYKYTVLKYFLYLLWFITFIEFFSWFVSSNNINFFLFFDENGIKYNLWFYNLLRIVTYSTYFYIYSKSVSTKKFKISIQFFWVTYLILIIINWSIIQNFAFEISIIPKIIGSLFVVISVIFYLIELLKSEKIILFHRTILFWMSIGLLLYYSGTIPFSLKWNEYALIPGTHKLFLINAILAFTMYSIFTFGFIWSKKE